MFEVLLDGLNDTGSPLSKLAGVQKEVFEEIIWQVDLTRLRITEVTLGPCCPKKNKQWYYLSGGGGKLEDVLCSGRGWWTRWTRMVHPVLGMQCGRESGLCLDYRLFLLIGIYSKYIDTYIVHEQKNLVTFLHIWLAYVPISSSIIQLKPTGSSKMNVKSKTVCTGVNFHNEWFLTVTLGHPYEQAALQSLKAFWRRLNIRVTQWSLTQWPRLKWFWMFHRINLPVFLIQEHSKETTPVQTVWNCFTFDIHSGWPRRIVCLPHAHDQLLASTFVCILCFSCLLLL